MPGDTCMQDLRHALRRGHPRSSTTGTFSVRAASIAPSIAAHLAPAQPSQGSTDRAAPCRERTTAFSAAAEGGPFNCAFVPVQPLARRSADKRRKAPPPQPPRRPSAQTAEAHKNRHRPATASMPKAKVARTAALVERGLGRDFGHGQIERQVEDLEAEIMRAADLADTAPRRLPHVRQSAARSPSHGQRCPASATPCVPMKSATTVRIGRGGKTAAPCRHPSPSRPARATVEAGCCQGPRPFAAPSWQRSHQRRADASEGNAHRRAAGL